MPQKVMITYNGKTLCKSDWAKELGMPYGTFIVRYKKYYPHDLDSLFAPIGLDDYQSSDVEKSEKVYRGNEERKIPIKKTLEDFKLELSEKNKILIELNANIRKLRETIAALEKVLEQM